MMSIENPVHLAFMVDSRNSASTSRRRRSPNTWFATASHPRKPGGPSWRIMPKNWSRQTSLWFPRRRSVCSSFFLVLSHDRRRLLHFGVTSHPTAEWTARQLVQAFPWDSAPRYLLRDHDRIYGESFQNE